MADTITLKSSAYNGRYLQLDCKQVKDGLSGKSKIQWTLSAMGGTTATYYSTGPTTVNINGTQVYYKARTKWSSEEFPAKKGNVNGEIEVEHDNDGTKSISVSLKTVIYYGISQAKTYSATWELDPVPRGAYIVDAPLGYAHAIPPTITYENALDETAVEKVEIGIEDCTGEEMLVAYRECGKTGGSFTFDPADMSNINNRMPKDTFTIKVTFVIKTTTTDNSVYIDKASSEHYMVETADTLPSVELTLTPINPSSVPSALADKYIQGKTRVSGTITAYGKYGATISRYGYRMEKNHAWSESNTFTTDVITTAEEVEIFGAATDTRKFVGETKQSIPVLAYSKPLIEPHSGDTAILCHRSDGEGNRKSGSTKVWLKAKISYYSLGENNVCTLQWRAKLIDKTWGDQEWNDIVANKAEDGCFEFSGFICDDEFYLNSAYSVQIRAIDDLGEYEIKEFEIPTQEVALHLGSGGKRVTVGDYCDNGDEEYLFRSAWKAKFEQGIVGSLLPQAAGEDELLFAENCQEGITLFSTDETSGIVIKKSDTQITVLRITDGTGQIESNTYNSGAWLGWKKISTT